MMKLLSSPSKKHAKKSNDVTKENQKPKGQNGNIQVPPPPTEPRRQTMARKPERARSFFRENKFSDSYHMGELLGTGNFAVVREAVHRKTGERFAVKIISRDPHANNEKTQRLIQNEIDILWKVNHHPHVVQLKEIFEESHRTFLVMELVTGGELFDRIIEKEFYSEADARDLMHVIISTIGHMHQHGIVHRDLKPENILYTSKAADAVIKLADFGLAKLYTPDEPYNPLKTVCGTPQYVAPEVLKSGSGYTAQCDMWSIGVLLYILLCGFPPFFEERQDVLFRKISLADYDFPFEYWNQVSLEGAFELVYQLNVHIIQRSRGQDRYCKFSKFSLEQHFLYSASSTSAVSTAKDLVRKLLVVNPSKRLTPREALNHPWMLKTDVGGSMDMTQLKEYTKKINRRKFRMLASAMVIAKRLERLGTT